MRGRSRFGFGAVVLVAVAMLTLLGADPTGSRRGEGEVKGRIPPGPVTVKLTNGGDNKPVASAVVRIGGRYSVTGGDGATVLDGIPAGSYKLVIEHYGFDRVEQAVELPAGRRTPIALTLSPVVLTKVEAAVLTAGDGRPIAGAHIAFVATNVPALTFGRIDCHTDWAGKVTMIEMPVGRYETEITAAGCQSVKGMVEIKKGQAPLRFEMARVVESASLEVTAVDAATDKPIANAKVVLAEAWPIGLIREGATDAQGKAAFKDLRVAQLNWMGADNKLAWSRRRVQARVEATGYVPAFAIVSLDQGAKATVKLHSSAPIDEQEPNDTMANAQVVRVGVPIRLAIAKVGDKDFFRFRLDYPAAVRVEAGPKTAVETGVLLYTRDGTQIAANWAYVGGVNAVEANLPAGEYLVCVCEWGNNDARNEKFNLTITARHVPDVMEPNDDAGSARLIQSGEEVRGYKFPRGDRDLLRFRVTRPGWARVTMPPHALEHEVLVLDAAAKRLGAGYQYARQGIEVVVPVYPGWHTINLGEWGDTDCSVEPYSMRLEVIEDDGIDDPPTLPGRVQAVREAKMPGLIANTIDPIGDIDTYALALPSAGVVWARIIAPIETELEIVSADGKRLGIAQNYVGQPTVVSWHTSGPQTVYLRAMEWGNNGSSNCPYLLTTWFEPCDEMEAMGRNDKPAAAIPIDWGDTLRGSIDPVGDIDCYRAVVDHPGYVTLKGAAPVEIHIAVFDPKKRKIAEAFQYAGQPVEMHFPVLPGEHVIEVREWGDNGHSVQPYAYKVWLDRADPHEKSILRDDAPRPLKMGQGQPLVIEQVGDRDRYVFTTPGAGKYSVRTWAPIELTVRVFDDRTGQKVVDVSQYANQPLTIDLEPKGATRYLVEVTEWGDNGCSEAPGFILADLQGRELCGALLRAEVDPLEPRVTTFWLEPIKGVAAAASASVDADGDGRADFELGAGQRKSIQYGCEGLYAASAVLRGGNGASSIIGAWVDATGPRERKGVHLLVVSPGQKIIEQDQPCRVNAISYSGARIASVSAAVDGQVLATARTAPYELEIPWQTLAGGERKLTFTATDARGQTATAERPFVVSEYFDLQPLDGAVISGNAVRVSWQGPAFGPARVQYRGQGSDKWLEATGESGRQRVVLLPEMESGRTYEFQPVGGTEPGPIRTITRVKGLAFGRNRYAGTIARDYDQRLGVSVRNQSDKPMVVRLECGKPPEESKLLVGFVGEGSEGAPFGLKPGEEREFLLGISAQDCVKPRVTFPIRLVSDSGFSDEAEVDVNVKLPNVKLEWEVVGKQPDGLGQILRLHNRGDGLTDLRVASDNKDLHISPTIDHGVLPSGSSIDLVATPRLYEEFQKVEGGISAGAVDKIISRPTKIEVPDGKKVYGLHLTGGKSLAGRAPGAAASLSEQDILVARSMAGAYLNPAYVDWGRRTNGQDTDGDGRLDRWQVDDKQEGILWIGDDTDGDGEIDFVHADIGYDGQYDYSAFKTKDGWDPTNLVESYVEMGFKLPWARSAYEKHDVDILMGGKVVGQLRDSVPEGNYTFKLPPSAIQFNDAGTPGDNEIEIQSKHLRGGHYVVSSDFNLKMRMTGTHAFTVADSKEAAEQSIAKMKDLVIEGPDYSISSADVQVQGEMRKGADVAIIVPVRNVGATRSKDVAVALMRAAAAGGGAPVELARVYATDVPLTGSMPVRIPWKAAAGNHSLRIVVDPDKEAGDENRNNNEAALALTVPGDDAKPTIKIVEPADGTTFKDTIIGCTIQASDDSGVARVELAIDGGLPINMLASPGTPGTYADRCVLQPGAHALRARVTDVAGNQVEQTVRVTVDAKAPQVRILAPPDGVRVADRVTEITIEADPGVAAAAVRSNNGPWQRVALKDGQGTVKLELGYGACSIEAMAVGGRGARGTAKIGVQCPKQRPQDPEKTDQPQTQPVRDPRDAAANGGGASGPVKIDETGEFDPLGPANGPVDPPGGRPRNGAGAGGAGSANNNGTGTGAGANGGTGTAAGGGRGGRGAGGATAGEDGNGAATGAGGAGGGGRGATQSPDDDGAAAATNAGGTGGDGGEPATTLQPDGLPPVLPNRPPVPDQPQTRPDDPAANAGQSSYGMPPRGPVRPAGGFVQAQSKASDWYCTNRPNIKVKFRLPDWLRKKNLSYASKEEYERMVKKFIADMKRRGIDTSHLEKFQEALRRRIRQMDQPGELPGWLESFGLAKPKTNDPEELRKWREQMERAADAWYLKLLASGDPQLVAEGLKARAEAIGKFDEAMQMHAQAAVQQIQANQKLVEDCVEAMPMVGDVCDLYAAATGETLLTGERIGALERMIRLAGVLGPLGLEQLLKRSPNAQLVMQGLGEMAESMGKRGKEMLAGALGKSVKEIDNFLDAAAKVANKEIRLGRDEMAEKAERAAKEFAKTPEGMADAVRRTKENAEARDLLERLQKHPPDSPDFKKAVSELQSNKTAQSLINDPKVKDALRDKVNGQLKNVYDATDVATKADLNKFIKSNLPDDELRKMAKEMGMDPDVALRARKKVHEAVEKAGKKLDDVEVDVMTITNQRPGSKSTSVGRDRDVTYTVREKDVEITYPGTGEKVKKPGKNIVDVDHTVSEGPYNKNFYGVTNDGKLPLNPDGTINHKAIKEHADALDQTVTSKWHPEAYNTGDVQLKDFLDKSKTPTLTRIEDLRDTVSFKSDHWFEKAGKSAKAGDAVNAARNTAEGMRQATKQWDDLIMSRAKQYGLKPGNVPSRLQNSMDIFRKVKDGAITPAQAEHMLKAIGSSKEQAVREMCGFLEGMEKTAGAGWRRIKTAELVNDLHGMPGKGSTEWASGALQKINDALKRGEVSGPNFIRLRDQVRQGLLTMPRTPTWKQDVIRWADDALSRRMISLAEREALVKDAQ